MVATSLLRLSKRGNGCNLFVCSTLRCLLLLLVGPFIVAIVVEIAEVDENGKGHEEGLVLGLLHTLEVDLVIVHVAREEEFAAPWYLLEDVPDIIALGVRHVELHRGTGAAGKGAEEPPLTASAIGVQDVVVLLVPDGKGEVEARARITDETKRLPRTCVLDLHNWSVAWPQGAREWVMDVEGILCAPFSVYSTSKSHGAQSPKHDFSCLWQQPVASAA